MVQATAVRFNESFLAGPALTTDWPRRPSWLAFLLPGWLLQDGASQECRDGDREEDNEQEPSSFKRVAGNAPETNEREQQSQDKKHGGEAYQSQSFQTRGPRVGARSAR